MIIEKTFSLSLLLGIAVVAIIGCGVVPPRVQYNKVDISNFQGGPPEKLEANVSALNFSGYPFRQRRSILIINFDTAKGEFTVAPVPHELDSNGQYLPLYTVEGRDNYRSTTQLKVKYVDNTKFIDEIAVTTKDNIEDTMSKIGELGQALIPIISSMVSTTKQSTIKFRPTMIDPSVSTFNEFQLDPLNDGFCIRMRDIAVESTLTLDQFISNSGRIDRSTFPVPACATVLVDIASSCSDPKAVDPVNVVSLRTTFAHYDAVVPTPLPSTGTLKMSSICSASVTVADKEDRSDILKYLHSAVTAGQGIYTEWKKAKDAKKQN